MIKIRNLTKTFPHSEINRGIKNINLEIKEGEVICLLGPSGSGKSTLLKTIAGLHIHESGVIEKDVNHLASYVSQEYTLWPHLNVLENLCLAPRLQAQNKIHPDFVSTSFDKEEVVQKAQKQAGLLLEKFGLSDYRNNYPNQLSGGQKQRVALLRALMVKPKILLLDEITSALDPALVGSVQELILELKKEGYTMMIATHNHEFAKQIADRLIYLENGEVIEK